MKESKGAVMLSCLNIIGQLVLASILWVICSLPVFTLGASSCALYYAVVKALRRDRGSLIPCFFSAFRDNLGQCFFVNVFYMVIFALPAYLAIPHLTNLEQGLSSAFYVIVGVCFLFMLPLCVTYPVISRFYYKGISLAKFLLLLIGRHFMVCFSSLLLVAAGIVIVMNNAAALMFVPGGIAYIQCLMLEGVFKKYSDKDQGDYDLWYGEVD